MRANRLLMATMAAMFVMTVVPETGSFANSGKGRDGSGQGGTSTVVGNGTRFVAKLVPTGIQDPLFEGRAARRTQGTRDEFEARVEAPLSAVGPDPANSSPPVLHLVSANGGGEIVCTMEFDRDDSVVGIAEYKVSVRSRNGVTSNRAGSCTPSGVPSVGLNDTAFVTIGGVELRGNFAAKP